MKVLKIVAILGLICQTSFAEAAWEKSFERSPEKINCMKFVPQTNIGYMGTGSGLFVTRDNGESWERVDLRSRALKVKDIALGGNKIYVLTDKGVYRRKNTKTAEWEVIPGKSHTKGITSNGNTKGEEKIFSWTERDIYYLQGSAWISSGKNMKWKSIDHVASFGDKIFVASEGRIFSSLDGASSWEEVFLLKTYDAEELIPKVSEEHLPPASRIGNIDYSSSSGLTVSSTKGIFLIKKEGDVPTRIDTSGLPAGKVRWAVSTLGNIFASTDKKVFWYRDKPKKWEMVFEKVVGGKIIKLALSMDSKGNELLWILAEDVVSKIRVRDILYSAEIAAAESSPKKELSILEVQRMAIEYAEVSPEKINAWRKGARWKAVMPRLSVSFSESIDDNVEIYKNSNLSYVVTGPKERDTDWGVDLSWDLSDLVWNNDQTSIDVRSRLMVQTRGEILEDITRIYFERKRLLNEVGRTSSEKPTENSKKMLRIMELTAYIDAFTGGRFSASLDKNSTL